MAKFKIGDRVRANTPTPKCRGGCHNCNLYEHGGIVRGYDDRGHPDVYYDSPNDSSTHCTGCTEEELYLMPGKMEKLKKKLMGGSDGN